VRLTNRETAIATILDRRLDPASVIYAEGPALYRPRGTQCEPAELSVVPPGLSESEDKAARGAFQALARQLTPQAFGRAICDVEASTAGDFSCFEVADRFMKY